MLMKISKVLLVLVIIGFFCPIACDGNGVDMIRDGIRYSDEDILLVGVILAVAAISAAIGFVTVFTRKGAEKMGPYPVISTAAVAIAFCLGVSYMGDVEFLMEFLEYGAYLMAGGSIASLILALVDKLSGKKPKPDISPEEE